MIDAQWLTGGPLTNEGDSIADLGGPLAEQEFLYLTQEAVCASQNPLQSIQNHLAHILSSLADTGVSLYQLYL